MTVEQDALQIVTDDKASLSGTVFSSRRIINDDQIVLDALRSGGVLRGWYGGPSCVGDFELLTSEEIRECDDFYPDYGDGRRVSGGVVKRLADQGAIRIPRSEGRHNRIAIARVEGAAKAL